MKKFLFVFIYAVACLFSVHTSANSSNGTHEILHINLHDSGHIFLTLSGHSNTEGCGNTSTRNIVVIDKGYIHAKAMYAMALTALSSGKKVTGWTNGCVDVWGSGSLVLAKATTMVLSHDQ